MERKSMDTRLPGAPTLEEVVIAVCQHYGVTRDLVMSKRLRNNKPRIMAIMVARRLTQRGWKYLGRFFNNTAFTCICVMSARGENMCINDPEFLKKATIIINYANELARRRIAAYKNPTPLYAKGQADEYEYCS